MTLPTLTDPVTWRSPGNLGVAVRHLIDSLDSHHDLALTDLTLDPIEAITNCAHIDLRWVNSTGTGCALYGFYRSSPPTIGLHRSRTAARDNFTVLHELGHHVQQNDEAWALDVLAALSPFEARVLEEAVSDRFAATILIPDDRVAHLTGGSVTAAAIRDLHEDGSASRQATCTRVVQLGDPSSSLAIVLTDIQGRVEFGRSTNDSLVPPPSGSVQPDIQRLIKVALETDFKASGIAQEGLVYGTGSSRTDLRLDLALSSDGVNVFTVITPIYEYGDQDWGTSEAECSNEACGEHFFTVDAVLCASCRERKCPACRSCACEAPRATVCRKCFTELSVEEQAQGLAEHVECPF